MHNRLRAVALNLDGASLGSIQEALPDWDIELITGVTTAYLRWDWNPEATDLLVVGANGAMEETLGLCRSLRSQAGRAHTPLLVLVPPVQDVLIRALLEMGAHCCLVLPIHAKQVANMWAEVGAGNRPGHHTLNLDPAQGEDRWRDEGGQG